MTELTISLKGVRPLLMHSPNSMMDKKPNGSRKTVNYVPEDEAKAALHTNKDGVICVPAMAILGCMREAAKDHKVPGKGRKTLTKYVLSGLHVMPEMIPITPQEWVVDARPVVVQRARVIRWRPRFDEWALTFKINLVDESIFNPTLVRNVIEDAGKFVGLLDFRPYFGLFEVTSVVDDAGKEIK